eukprot:comp21709_c0_seq3/m.48322 comp21709_c0_seq3/g.48322  ORF comp21709_c0_seq3/g.48322 comp21709_c0_seq3/m.48322 type:complete len:484 (+) comp21709_c0_seq3:3-1454(+)
MESELHIEGVSSAAVLFALLPSPPAGSLITVQFKDGRAPWKSCFGPGSASKFAIMVAPGAIEVPGDYSVFIHPSFSPAMLLALRFRIGSGAWSLPVPVVFAREQNEAEVVAAETVLINPAAKIFTGPKHALIIANETYQSHCEVADAVEDARNVERALRALQFQVEVVVNASTHDLKTRLLHFGRKMNTIKGAMVVFCYIGHGVQLGAQVHMLATDAKVFAVDEIVYEGVSADILWNQLSMCVRPESFWTVFDLSSEFINDTAVPEHGYTLDDNNDPLAMSMDGTHSRKHGLRASGSTNNLESAMTSHANLPFAGLHGGGGSGGGLNQNHSTSSVHLGFGGGGSGGSGPAAAGISASSSGLLHPSQGHNSNSGAAPAALSESHSSMSLALLNAPQQSTQVAKVEKVALSNPFSPHLKFKSGYCLLISSRYLSILPLLVRHFGMSRLVLQEIVRMSIAQHQRQITGDGQAVLCSENLTTNLRLL